MPKNKRKKKKNALLTELDDNLLHWRQSCRCEVSLLSPNDHSCYCLMTLVIQDERLEHKLWTMQWPGAKVPPFGLGLEVVVGQGRWGGRSEP